MTGFTVIKKQTSLYLFCVLSLIIAGCGKVGMPEPQDAQHSFFWDAIQAEPYGTCLAFSGLLSEAHHNLDKIRLELAAINGADDCPGCPFVPKQVLFFSPSEAGYNPDDGTIAFSYCPTPAKAYRWRLSGISKYSRIPHTISYEQMTVIEPF